MSKRITWIHTADLHLGAPFRGLRALSPAWADRMVEAIPEAFDRLLDLAIQREVDFMVIAGDIFDAAQPSYRDVLHFADGMKRLSDAGIPVYFCTGNHDPYTSWKNSYVRLPESVHMFPASQPGFFLYERDGEPLCVLGGRGYYNQTVSAEENLAAGITKAAAQAALGVETPFGVGVLHTGLHLDNVKAPTDPRELRAAGFDYWALGHIHQPYFDTPTDPHLVFSGCIQGRDIKETGPRGCYVVTLEEGAPNQAEFVPLASVVWQKLTVDISECATLTDCHDAIMRELFTANGHAQCEEMVERVTLVGKTPLHHILRQPGVVEDLRQQINDGYPVFFCDALIDRTSQPIDRAALAAEGLFPSALLAQSARMEDSPNDQVDYLQREFLAHSLQLPSSCVRNIDRLIREAEEEVLDLLGGPNDD